MTKLLKLFFLLFLPCMFYACKSDDIVANNGGTTNSAEMYSYTSQPVTYDNNVYRVVTIDRNSYYAASFDKFYKVTNNVPALFTPNADVFHPNTAFIYDDNYIVFAGTRISDGKKQLMIFDNGAYTIADLPVSYGASLSNLVFYGRAKFFCTFYDSLKYVKYDSGTFSAYTVPGQFIRKIGKSGSSIYLIVRNPSFERTIYKINESGYNAIRTEPEDLSVETLNSDILQFGNSPTVVSYFSETGWNSMFTLENSYYDYPSTIKGETRNNFIGIREGGNDSLLAYVWNGTNYIKQTNVPPDVNFQNMFFYSTSEYRDNTFYILATNNDDSKKVFKVTLR
ncbi:MAG: hypothetical protein K1X86_10245 [Ignavibacteria bacterium]|nr:hypothetical protein [Ignavibacteria bacterium]